MPLKTEWLNTTEILEGKMWNKGVVRAMLPLKPGEDGILPCLFIASGSFASFGFPCLVETWPSSLSPCSQGILPIRVSSLCVQISPLYEDTQYMLDAQSCPTLCKPIDCRPPGSFVHGIHQARILEWMAIPCSRESSWSRDRTWISCIAGIIFTVWATKEAPC